MKLQPNFPNFKNQYCVNFHKRPQRAGTEVKPKMNNLFYEKSLHRNHTLFTKNFKYVETYQTKVDFSVNYVMFPH